MTSTHTEDTGTDPAAEDAIDDNEPEPSPAEPDTDDSGDDGKSRYRRRAQAAEAERDQLREQLDAVRRQIAEDACGLAKPAGMWAAGVDVNDLFTDDGRLDRDRLSASVTDAVDRLGLTWAPRTPKPDPSQGMSSGSNYGHATWGDLLDRQ